MTTLSSHVCRGIFQIMQEWTQLSQRGQRKIKGKKTCNTKIKLSNSKIKLLNCLPYISQMVHTLCTQDMSLWVL